MTNTLTTAMVNKTTSLVGLNEKSRRTMFCRSVSAPSMLSLDKDEISRRASSTDTMSTTSSSSSVFSDTIYTSVTKSSLKTLNSKNLKKSVSFQSIEIREHVRDINDNPSVTCGPPVGLGWEYTDLPALSLTIYEDTRPARRSRQEFQIPPSVREDLLREQGFSRSEIFEAARNSRAIQIRRRATIAKQEIESTQWVMECLSRKIKKLVTRTNYKKEEAKLWKNAELLAQKTTSVAPLTGRQVHPQVVSVHGQSGDDMEQLA